MVKLADVITSIDLYPINPVFYVNGNEGYQSIAGAVKTLIMAACFFYFLYEQVNDYIYTENPTELIKTEIASNNSITLNRDNFFIAVSFSFEEVSNYEIDKTIKIGRVFHKNGVDPKNHEYLDNENLYFTNCSKMDFSQFEISDAMKRKLISEAKCLIFNNFTINTSEFDGDANLEISVYKDLFYDSYLTGYTSYDNYVPFNFTLYYQNLISSPSYFHKSPIKKTINAKTYLIYSYNTYEYVSNIMTITSIKKGDFLRKSEYKKNFTYYYINKFDISSDLKYQITVNYDYFFYRIFSLRLVLDDKNEIRIINYPTVLEVVSNLGGTLGLILSVAEFLLDWAQKFEQTQYIINKFFNNDSIFEESSNQSIQSIKFPKTTIQNRSNKNVLQEKVMGNYISNIENNLNVITNNQHNRSMEVKSQPARSLSNLVDNNNINEQSNFNSNIIRSKTLNMNGNLKKKRLTASTIKKRKSRAQFSFFFFKSEKSPYTKLFQMFLGIENIVKWNEEWLCYKSLIFSHNMQILFKYIDLTKLYKNEQNLNPFYKNQDEFTKTWKKFKEVNDNNEKQYLDKFKKMIEASFMK